MVSYKGRYNQWQRTMLQWSGMFTYNAVHVVKIAEAIRPARFEERVNHVLDVTGLGRLLIDQGRGTYCFERGNPGCPVEVIAAGDDAMAALSTEMERQLNESFPFDCGFTPFRFFMMPIEDETYLGIAYFHAVADAESVSRLLFEIVRSCFTPEPGPLLDESLRPLRGSRLPFGNPVSALRRMGATLRRFQTMRKSIRPPSCEENDFRNAFVGFSFDSEQTQAVLSRAKEWEVTVNDLCLAALLKAISVDAAKVHWLKENRPLLSVGCVVNLRRDLAERRRKDFGLFLGSFAVTHAVTEAISLRDLARSVRSQTLIVKRLRLYLTAPLEFMISRYIFGRLPLEKKRNFYRKGYPLWGGITNMKMGTLNTDPGDIPVVDYFRAVSAGPAMPLVIAVTGAAELLNFGVSYRPAVFAVSEAAGLIERFRDLLLGAGGAS